MKTTILPYNLDSILINPAISSRLKKILNYSSLLLFIALVAFVSSSVNKYVNDTLSIKLVQAEPEDFQENIFSQTVIVKKGDTLKTILTAQNIPKVDIEKIVRLVKSGKLEATLKIGQQINFEYETKITENAEEDLASEISFLNKITIAVDKLKTIEVIRENDDFLVQNVIIPLNKELAKSSIVINSNFMSALKSLGLSNNSIIELINAYAYQIDFQRQIKSGDTATVITEKYVTEDGKFSHHGKILYVSLNLSGKEYNIYRYSHDNMQNNHSFFSEDGKSVKRSLLKTPLKLIRVSSHYGNRKHPILGYTKMHKGVDFAAPKNTPISSAGNGVITEMRWKSGYGNFVKIKHSGTLSTAYAHATSFAKNLKVGSIVKQGQVIAYVGSTGKATGPHLHYEVEINGKNVNPMSVKTTPGIELNGKNLVKFNQFKKEIKTLSIKLDKELKIDSNAEVSL
ncbi:peptidoglycan DD-metalloendopeptidase family protein [Rickettsia endosymbiont of Halotydeus destructor]|uniref:M23 family metallopeptidase n=1 Tax=Rickettsia endosymbiont of Halotydeus destructor TaxID=2996754 RepID=UPI003BAF209D